MKKILLIILPLVVILLIGGFLFFRFRPGTSQNHGKSPFTIPAKIPQPPKEPITVLKGFWMPCSFLDDSCQSMNEPKLIKETGANIIGIAPNIKINSKGEISSFPMDFIEKRINDYAQKYYPADIRIFISPTLDFAEDLNSRSGGEPRPIPKEAAAKTGFLDKYDLVIEDLAKLAEKYHIEMFSPMNEPDIQLGLSISSAWGQSILPKIKKQYHGKVLWKAGLADQVGREVSFKGYDVLGLDFSAPGGPESPSLTSYPTIVNQIINQALSWAKRDGVKEVAFTEFGAWGGAVKFSEQGKIRAHQIVFEQGKDKVQGFIILDPPPDLGDRPLKGSKTLAEIKLWFTEKLAK